MKATVTLTGKSPLLVHNIQLANPDNEWSKKISAITKKRQKTEEDRIEIARLEWLGSLYTHEAKIVIPTANILKCLIETGKVTKQGKGISRSVSFYETHVPLVFNGPPEPEKLWKKEEFRDTTLVGVQKKRVLRTRPIFRAWALQADVELLTETMDLDDLKKIVDLAGRVEGLGDNRVNGYGRFTAEIIIASNLKRAA